MGGLQEDSVKETEPSVWLHPSVSTDVALATCSWSLSIYSAGFL